MDRTWQARGAPSAGTGYWPSVLLVAWVAFVIYGTWLPFDFARERVCAAAKITAFGNVGDNRLSRVDVTCNVLLFMPYGFLIACRRAGHTRGFGRALLVAAGSGFGLSLVVESGQVLLPGRTPSILDLAANTTGAVLGAALGWPFGRHWGGETARVLKVWVSANPMGAWALAAGTWLVVAGVAPFDVSLARDDLKRAVYRARLVPFGPRLGGGDPPAQPWAWAESSLEWSLAGGATALALRAAGRRRATVLAGSIGGCGALALAICAAQLALPSRTADMTMVVFALGGAAAGASTVLFFRQADVRRWASPALVLWILSVVLAAWTPPRVSPAGIRLPAWSQLVPFWCYYLKTDIYAVSDLGTQVLAFVPLGALVGARGVRKPVRWSLVAGAAIGLVLETGQLALVERTAEITDVLSATAGAALGAWLWSCGVTAVIAARNELSRSERPCIPCCRPPRG